MAEPTPRRRPRWGLWISVGTLSAIAGGIFAFWLIYVRAPSPQEVCAHLIALTRQDAGDAAPRAVDALVSRLEARCVEDKSRIMKMRDKLEYAKYARCVIAATSLETAERC